MPTLLAELMTALTLLSASLTHVSAQITPSALHALQSTQITETISEPKTLPFFNKDGITEKNVWGILDKIILCESSGKRGIEILDVNNKMSRGELMFQDSTWEWMSKKAGIHGSPLERGKAIQVARWGLINGYGSHWSCFKQAKSGIDELTRK